MKLPNQISKILSLSVLAGLLFSGLGVVLPVNAQVRRSGDIPFRDISGLVCEQSIKNLYVQGVVDGYTPDEFRPELVVTRGQMATFVVRAFGLELDTTSILDTGFTDSIEGPHKEDILILQRLGAVNGYSDGRFAQGRYVSRGEIAKLVYNGMIGARVEAKPEDSNFVDVPDDHPFDKYIGYVESLGIVQGYSDSTFRADDWINRCEMALIMDRAVDATANIKATTTFASRFPDVKNISCREAAAELAEDINFIGIDQFHRTPVGSTSIGEFNEIADRLFGDLLISDIENQLANPGGSSFSSQLNTPEPAPVVSFGEPIFRKQVNSADGFVNVRNNSDVRADRLGFLLNGTQFDVYEERNGWYKVNFNGSVGWLFNYYTIDAPSVQPTPTPEVVEEVEESVSIEGTGVLTSSELKKYLFSLLQRYGIDNTDIFGITNSEAEAIRRIDEALSNQNIKSEYSGFPTHCEVMEGLADFKVRIGR